MMIKPEKPLKFSENKILEKSPKNLKNLPTREALRMVGLSSSDSWIL